MSSKENASRRDFLKLVGVAAPSAAAAIASSGAEAEASSPDLSSDRMQDTAHTRAYYESARF